MPTKKTEKNKKDLYCRFGELQLEREAKVFGISQIDKAMNNIRLELQKQNSQ